MSKDFRFFSFFVVFFITILLVSNVSSSAKMVDLGFSLFGVPLLFDAGTIFFPFAYIVGDILTEIYGFEKTKKVIWLGFFSLLFSSAAFALVAVLPAETAWQNAGGNQSYMAIFGGMMSGGIFIASLLAYLFGEFSNAFVLQKMKIWTKEKFLVLRTLGSSVFGQFFDSLIFVGVATVLGVFPPEIFLSLLLTNYLLKMFVEILITPVTLLVIGFLKKHELK